MIRKTETSLGFSGFHSKCERKRRMSWWKILSSEWWRCDRIGSIVEWVGFLEIRKTKNILKIIRHFFLTLVKIFIPSNTFLFNFIWKQKPLGRISHYKNWRFLNLELLKSQTRFRSNSAILDEVLRFEI